MLYKQALPFMVARLSATMGDQFLLFAVPLMVYKATESISMAGLAFFVEWLPRIISLPIAGTLTDRYSPKKIYLLADIVRTFVCLLAAALIVVLPQHTFAWITTMMAIVAFMYAQSFVSIESSLPRIFPYEMLPKAQSVVQGIDQTSQIGGSLIAALLISVLDTADLLYVAAGMFATSFLVMLTLKLNVDIGTSPVRGGILSVYRDMRQGLQIIRESPVLIFITILSVTYNLIYGVELATGAAIVKNLFRAEDYYYGYMQTFTGILGILFLMMMKTLRRHFGLFAIGMGVYIFVVVAVNIMLPLGSFMLFASLYCATLASSGLFNVFIRTERARWIPKSHLGKTTGVIVLINQLSLPLSGILVMLFSDRFGSQYLFNIVGLIGVLVLFLLFMPLRNELAVTQTVKSSVE